METQPLNIHNREEFRSWLSQNADKEKECFLMLKRGKPDSSNQFFYLDAVEEALCFGWIDSTLRYENGITLQRFTPRNKKSNWTELNKERARRLIRLGRMTQQGRKVLPPLGPRSFHPNPKVIKDLKQNRVWTKFTQFPPLYQRVRLYNLDFYINLGIEAYERMLFHVIETTRKGVMFGEWNDYGRLLEY